MLIELVVEFNLL